MAQRKPRTLPGMFGTYQRLGVHVLASNMTVIRKARQLMLTPEVRNAHDRESRRSRKRFYRTMLKHHKEAADLFRRYRF